MNPLFSKVVPELLRQGWVLRERDSATKTLMLPLSPGHREVPVAYINFAMHHAACVAGDEQAWLHCFNDFAEVDESQFRWNEFELISLDAAGGDKVWASQIRAFWTAHFPIYTNVRSGYEYLAIELRSGRVVAGYEPGFEETTDVATDLEDFADKVVSGTIRL